MSAPADAARVADCLGVERTPPVRSVIAATRSPFRIRPVPEIPSSWASRCRSETSNLERSPPLRPDDRGDAAAGCPMGGSSDAGAAPLRSSVVSLTNGPSIMILGRLGVFSTRVPWRQARSHCSQDPHLLMMKVAAAIGVYSRTSRLPCARPVSGAAGVKMCCGVALRGTYRSPGVTLRARSLGRYTLPPRRRLDDQHPPRIGATDAVPSLTPTAPTAFLCSHPCRGKGVLAARRGVPGGKGHRSPGDNGHASPDAPTIRYCAGAVSLDG